jgi:hypothetical protein
MYNLEQGSEESNQGHNSGDQDSGIGGRSRVVGRSRRSGGRRSRGRRSRGRGTRGVRRASRGRSGVEVLDFLLDGLVLQTVRRAGVLRDPGVIIDSSVKVIEFSRQSERSRTLTKDGSTTVEINISTILQNKLQRDSKVVFIELQVVAIVVSSSDTSRIKSDSFFVSRTIHIFKVGLLVFASSIAENERTIGSGTADVTRIGAGTALLSSGDFSGHTSGVPVSTSTIVALVRSSERVSVLAQSPSKSSVRAGDKVASSFVPFTRNGVSTDGSVNNSQFGVGAVESGGTDAAVVEVISISLVSPSTLESGRNSQSEKSQKANAENLHLIKKK